MKRKLAQLWKTYQNMSTPAKASIWFLVCNILQMGINVLTTPIFTRIMSQEAFGITNTYYSWRSILMIFTSLNLSYGVFNNAMVKHEDAKTRDQYVSCMQCLYMMITCGYFVFYICFHDWCNRMLGMSTEMVVLLFFELLCYPALLFWSGRQRYEFKYRWLVVVSLLMSFAYVAVGVVAVLWSEDKALAKIASGVVVNVAFGGFFMIYHFFKGRKLCIPKFWKYALAFNIPLVPHYLAEIVLTQSDRIMITKFDTAVATANYSIAYSLVMLMQLIMNAISASFVPWAYGCLKKKNFTDLRKLANVLLVLISGCILLLMMFVPEIIYVFAGKKYMDAIYVIPPIALSILFILMYEFFSTIEFYYEKNIFVMIASVIAAAANVGLNWYFIPIYGYYAAGYTTLFCYLAYAVGHYFVYKRICKKTLGVKDIFDIKALGIAAVLMTAVTLMFNFVYDYMIIRYLFALALVGVAFWKRNYLLERFKQMRTEKE